MLAPTPHDRNQTLWLIALTLAFVIVAVLLALGLYPRR
jgi:hypothetical protein